MPALRGPSPLLRLASDERLIALTRAGQQAAFEALVARYQQRLLAFCRHMLRSREDAEDVLQEVFAAAFNAIMADTREINARPWLYRIARNRSLNHLRRATAIGVDSMDTHFADEGQSTSEKVHRREEFRQLMGDIGHLPESQRSALVLREMDALSYEQIADVMDTTVPSVKSLLVRARIGLAEAAEARKLTCEEVRVELGEVAEGLRSTSAPVRRHVKQCDRCRAFRVQLRANNRALAVIMPLGPLVLLKKTLFVKLGIAKLWAGGAGASGGAATAGGAAGGAGMGGAAAAVTGGSIGGMTAAGAVTAKVVLVVATAAAVGVGGEKILDPQRTAPAAAHAQSLASTPAPAPAVALPRRQHRVGLFTLSSPSSGNGDATALHVASLVAPFLRGAAATPAVVTPDATSPPVAPPADTTAPPAAGGPTPTTQEISTTTVFPSAGATAATGASGVTATTTTVIATTGTTTGETISTTTSLTGTTGTTGTTATTGATSPTAGTASVSGAGATGPTGPTGATGG